MHACTSAEVMEDEIEDMEEENLDQEEDGHDVDDEGEGDAETPEEPIKPKGRRKPRSVLTGRGVTLGMLLDDGVMEAGEKCLSIDYLVSWHNYMLVHYCFNAVD